MAVCNNIPRKNTRYCVGDFRKQIEIKVRDITVPVGSSVDHGELFTDFLTVRAIVETLSGVEIFDGTNTMVGVATHQFIINFRPGVTFENMVVFKGKNYRILDVTNIDEEDRFLKIRATERGVNTLPVNTA